MLVACCSSTAEANLFQRADDERVLRTLLRPPGRAIELPHITLFDELLLPLLRAHRFFRNAVDGIDLEMIGEHAEVLADRDQRRMLVVQPHAHPAVGALRNLGNRRGDVGVLYARPLQRAQTERASN